MKRFSIWHIPAWSFFSRPLYCDVALRWRGTNFGYLLLLLVVVWIPVAIGIHASLSRFLDEKGPGMVAQVPHFSLQDGKASITEPQPYTIKDPDTDEPFIIIDTTGEITSLDDTTAKMLVMETKMTYQKNRLETRTVDFRDMEDFSFGPDEFKAWLDTIGQYAAIVLYPLAVIGSFIYRVVQAADLRADRADARRDHGDQDRLSGEPAPGRRRRNALHLNQHHPRHHGHSVAVRRVVVLLDHGGLSLVWHRRRLASRTALGRRDTRNHWRRERRGGRIKSED